MDFETNNADPIVSRLVTSSDAASLTVGTFLANGSSIRSGAEGSLDQSLRCQALGRPEGTYIHMQVILVMLIQNYGSVVLTD